MIGRCSVHYRARRSVGTAAPRRPRRRARGPAPRRRPRPRPPPRQEGVACGARRAARPAARADPTSAWRPRGAAAAAAAAAVFRAQLRARPARRARSIFCCGTPGTATAPPSPARRATPSRRPSGARGPLRPSERAVAADVALAGSRVAERDASRRGGRAARAFFKSRLRGGRRHRARARRRARPAAGRGPRWRPTLSVIRRPPLPMERRPWAATRARRAT